MTSSEAVIDHLEEMIPSLASGAFRQAYFEALSTSGSVLEVIDGILYEVHSDGTKTMIKSLAPNRKVEIGTKVLLR